MAYKEGQLIGSTSIVDKIGEVLTIVCFLTSPSYPGIFCYIILYAN